MPVTYVPVSVPNASTYTVLAKNSGLVHYLPDFTSTCTITPPTPKAGLWFEFVYNGGAADAQNAVINTGTNTNYFVGGVVWLTNGTPDVEAVYSDGNSNSKLTLVTPGAGTRVKIECTDDLTWKVSGHVVSATTPAFADQ